MGLYTDYVILLLINPIPSLSGVQKSLDMLDKLSYYKVNNTKSKIFNIGLNYEVRSIVRSTYPFQWNESKIDTWEST